MLRPFLCVNKDLPYELLSVIKLPCLGGNITKGIKCTLLVINSFTYPPNSA